MDFRRRAVRYHLYMQMAVPYGSRQLALELAGAEPILPAPAAPLADETAAVYEALRHPLGAPPLGQIVRPGESVAIVVNDVTRLARTDLLLPPLVETLNRAGVPDAGICIVFALGTHRRQSEAEQRRLLGGDLFGRIRSFDHDCDADLVTLGTTRFGNTVEINRRVWEADRIVLTGEIVYHQIAGYSGGRKTLVPGVAGRRTITFNHSMIFHPCCRAGLLEGNPAHEDLLEACRMAEPDFIVNVVIRPPGAALRVVAGDLEAAHREGCRTADELLSAPIGGLYDVVIASSGGHPLDIDLRQAHKGMENAVRALKPGGTLFYYAECENGSGSPRFDEFVAAYPDDAAMERALRERFVIGGHKAFWVERLARLYNVHLVSTLDPGFVQRCHLKPVAPQDHQARLGALLAAAPGARVAFLPYAGFTMPQPLA